MFGRVSRSSISLELQEMVIKVQVVSSVFIFNHVSDYKIGQPEAGVGFVNHKYDYRPNWTCHQLIIMVTCTLTISKIKKKTKQNQEKKIIRDFLCKISKI